MKLEFALGFSNNRVLPFLVHAAAVTFVQEYILKRVHWREAMYRAGQGGVSQGEGGRIGRGRTSNEQASIRDRPSAVAVGGAATTPSTHTDRS